MNTVFEINMANARADVNTGRVKPTSPVVEVFSALVAGKEPNVDAKTKDKAVKTLAELSSKAIEGDCTAQSEINAIIRFSIEPKLLEMVRLYNFMGTYHCIGYHEAPFMKTYKYESVDSRFQASSSDVPFAAYAWREYPIGTQTISAGFAVDYREIQSGNFDGTIAEGMNQVLTDMHNKSAYYVMMVLYNALKNAKGVKHFAESSGITKTGVDNMLKSMRRYGKVNIAGDYSVISQFNDFVGFKEVGGNNFRFGADVVAEEIRQNGLVKYYNGSFLTELPNAINWTKLNKDGTDYDLYMPQGLLFFLPQRSVSPLQVFLRGGLTTMTGDDITTRQHLTRFDMELGAGVAEGMEDQIGLISDTNFDLPDAG